jgi:hypothetical protein
MEFERRAHGNIPNSPKMQEIRVERDLYMPPANIPRIDDAKIAVQIS